MPLNLKSIGVNRLSIFLVADKVLKPQTHGMSWIEFAKVLTCQNVGSGALDYLGYARKLSLNREPTLTSTLRCLQPNFFESIWCLIMI